MLIFKKIRSVFMDNRKKALRRFFSKNTDLMFIYQNKLKYSLKDSFFVESFYSAKQHIKHKRIFVNGVLVTDPNFLLKNTDIVSLKNRGKTKTKIKYFTKCWQVNDKKPLRNGLIISYKTASFNFFYKKRDDLSLEEKNWLLLRKKTLSKLKYV
jgi:ribosomal protein S4